MFQLFVHCPVKVWTVSRFKQDETVSSDWDAKLWSLRLFASKIVIMCRKTNNLNKIKRNHHLLHKGVHTIKFCSPATGKPCHYSRWNPTTECLILQLVHSFNLFHYAPNTQWHAEHFICLIIYNISQCWVWYNYLNLVNVTPDEFGCDIFKVNRIIHIKRNAAGLPFVFFFRFNNFTLRLSCLPLSIWFKCHRNCSLTSCSLVWSEQHVYDLYVCINETRAWHYILFTR